MWEKALFVMRRTPDDFCGQKKPGYSRVFVWRAA